MVPGTEYFHPRFTVNRSNRNLICVHVSDSANGACLESANARPCNEAVHHSFLNKTTTTMRSTSFLLSLMAMLFALTTAFAPTTTSTSPFATTRSTATELHMGGKQAKFGVFSPAVYGAKVALGTDKLNKLRGKAISLHSQYIGDFCQWAGAYHLRTKIIKKAKTNGDILGFLV